MNILFDSEEKSGRRFSLEKFCKYCGDPCEKEFCCEAHENLFYSEEELSREEDVYPDEDDEMDDERREQIKNDSM